MYRADSEAQLDGVLGALSLSDWMRFTVTPLDPHPIRRSALCPIAGSAPRPGRGARPSEPRRGRRPQRVHVRAATQIDAASPDLGWLNKAIFVSVGGRQAANVIYETYLVG